MDEEVFNGEAFFTTKFTAKESYGDSDNSFVHSFLIKDDTNVLNIENIDNRKKLVSALDEVNGLWDMKGGFMVEKYGENPFSFGSKNNINYYKFGFLKYGYDLNTVDDRLRPLWEALKTGNSPTIENSKNYYGNLFRFAFGDVEVPFDRLSIKLIDHELMYAICQVLINNDIAGYGAPRLGFFTPEIMLCHPRENILPYIPSQT